MGEVCGRADRELMLMLGFAMVCVPTGFPGSSTKRPLRRLHTTLLRHNIIRLRHLRTVLLRRNNDSALRLQCTPHSALHRSNITSNSATQQRSPALQCPRGSSNLPRLITS